MKAKLGQYILCTKKHRIFSSKLYQSTEHFTQMRFCVVCNIQQVCCHLSCVPALNQSALAFGYSSCLQNDQMHCQITNLHRMSIIKNNFIISLPLNFSYGQKETNSCQIHHLSHFGNFIPSCSPSGLFSCLLMADPQCPGSGLILDFTIVAFFQENRASLILIMYLFLTLGSNTAQA